jgi:uncharacterized protein YdgA (DUF945 family)
MKKIVTLLSVPVALLVAWGGASWYVGQQTETTLRQFIEQQNQQAAGRGVKQELVSYTKTAFGGKAITKLTFDVPPLSEDIGTVQFVNDVQNGPVFFGGGSPIAFGMSRINTELDMETLDAGKRDTLKTAFAGKAPLEGHTTIGFSGDTAYHFTMNPLKLSEEGTTMSVEGAELSGTYNAQSQGDIDMHVGKLEMKEANTQFSIPSMDVTGEMTGMLAGQALGTFDMKAPQVSILAEGTTEAAVFDLALQVNNAVQDNAVSASVNVDVNNIKGVKDTLSKFNYKLDMSGMNVDGLKAVEQLQAEMQNTLAQTDWNADAMETPEGQKKQQELIQKMSQTGEQVMDTIFSKVLISGKSRLHTVLMAESPKGKLNADIDLTYAGQGKPPSMMELLTYGPNDWAKMMKGKWLLDADKAILPEGTEMLLSPLSSQGLLTLDGEKIKSEAVLDGENIVLNGKSMPFADLIQSLVPAGAPSGEAAGSTEGNSTAADLGIPPDLMQRIDKEGLTPRNHEAAGRK